MTPAVPTDTPNAVLDAAGASTAARAAPNGSAEVVDPAVAALPGAAGAGERVVVLTVLMQHSPASPTGVPRSAGR